MIEVTSEAELDLGGISVVRFWASWSIPCKALLSLLNDLSKEFEEVNFYSLNIDECHDIAKGYKIQHIPTLIFFDDTVEIDRIIGITNKKTIEQIIFKDHNGKKD